MESPQIVERAEEADTHEILTSKIEAIFEAQRNNQYAVAQSTVKERKRKLKRLFDAMMVYREEIREAISTDFRRHPSEVDLTEIYPTTSGLRHAMAHLGRWAKPHRVRTPLSLMGSSSHIHYEPKGVVLIISPWNFPVNLTFGPLTTAIAAGNCVMIKPSEHTFHSSAVMKKIIEEIFETNEIAVIAGGVEASTALLNLPFNHIFFTGSPSVGKIVMEAASKHLTSVTLELGGKSPTIVDETANLDIAARRIAWSKSLNSGQICIAPDYLFVHESQKDAFIEKLSTNLTVLYGQDAQSSDSYSRIINRNHFNRILGYMDDALSQGAQVVYGGRTVQDENYIEPTVMVDVHPQSKLMTEEIFGPVLPVQTYRSIEEPLEIINSKCKPLTLYIYSKNQQNIKYIIDHTRAGGTCINHSILQFSNHNLPFGGSNHSGIGKGHGFFGFQEFSNARGVFKQWFALSAIELMLAPYTKFKQLLIDFSIKYF